MADASDIATVRFNTDEPEETTYSDEVIGGLIDADGVAGASATIWRWKAGALAKLSADVTEAGASHKNSELYKAALAMSKSYEVDEAVLENVVPAPRVNRIERD